MTTEHKEEAGPVTVQIGVCSVCHALFLISPERETSPCHGSDPLAVLATLTIGADGEIEGFWGSHAPRPMITREEAIAHLEALGSSREEAEKTLGPEPPSPAPAPPTEPPAAEGEEGPPETIPPGELLPRQISAFLEGGEAADPDGLKRVFEVAGAEPEAAATAVGRLEAVRELLEQLQTAREPAPVAPAPPEAENSPQNS